jgi:acyl-CoA thioester hydrolase
MSDIGITYRGMVHQWHCDHMGHMNVMWYVGKFDEATWNLAAALGMTSEYLRQSRRGMAAVDQRVSYRREALVGDIIVVRSAVLELKPKSIRFVHEMFRGDAGDHLATMLVTGVHIDAVARRSTQFEPHIFAMAQPKIVANAGRWDEWPPRTAHLSQPNGD